MLHRFCFRQCVGCAVTKCSSASTLSQKAHPMPSAILSLSHAEIWPQNISESKLLRPMLNGCYATEKMSDCMAWASLNPIQHVSSFNHSSIFWKCCAIFTAVAQKKKDGNSANFCMAIKCFGGHIQGEFQCQKPTVCQCMSILYYNVNLRLINIP